MDQAVIVPTRIEACFLDKDRVVTKPLGEYGGLPWLTKDELGRFMDVHFENAYLGEEILFPPFQNESSVLEKGVHLHWIIPPFLGKSTGKKVLPAIPNRWKVQKYDSKNDLIKEWIVVSDYIHYPTLDKTGAIHLVDDYSIFPIPTSIQKQGDGPPFCYVGKSFDTSKMPSDLESHTYHTKFNQNLTVLGPGNTQFSSSYINCKSIFGFYDESGLPGHSYKIIGWHSDSLHDLIQTNVNNEFEEKDLNLDEMTVFIEEKFKLNFDANKSSDSILDKEKTPRTLYTANILIDKPGEMVSTEHLSVSIGNTPTEALSALVASKIHPSNALKKVESEDEIEYFLMNSLLDGHLVDHTAKFIESRHKKGFYLHKGGVMYGFKAQHVGQTPSFKGYPIPETLYTQLNTLNLNKLKLNEAKNELNDLKTQLYSDWYKYMRAAYPPVDVRGEFPDSDQLKELIQYHSLEDIKSKKNSIDNLESTVKNQMDSIGSTYATLLTEKRNIHQPQIGNISPEDARVTMSTKQEELTTLQKEAKLKDKTEDRLIILEKTKALEKEIQALKDNIEIVEELNKQLALLKSEDENFPLKLKAEQVFWEPSEPVIAIDGFNFGERSSETSFFLANYTEKEGIPELESRVFPPTLKLSELDWCPYYMEWDVGLEQQFLNIYDQKSFLTNFYLDNDSPGVYQKPEATEGRDGGAYFQGGTILSPYASTPFVEGMSRYADHCSGKIAHLKIDEEKNAEEIIFWDAKHQLAINALLNISVEKEYQKLCDDKIAEFEQDKEDLKGSRKRAVLEKIVAWKEAKTKSAKGKDILCQKLAGFNQSCLMARQVPQLEIKEPLGFLSSTEFSQLVAEECKDHTKLSPAPFNDFMPIRNGNLRLRKLRFIDNFGI
ncbi:MAG: hypothetical protein JKY54_02530 [Flavobacteriales bacterium]|nr:hypothetical protein [Flavobacteriales bacterium]